MENASKALIIAAEVLVGLMIISIAVYLFNEMGRYSAETTQTIEDRQIAQFNEQFLKYYGTITTTDSDGNVTYQGARPCTIHDIVGLANLAKQSNIANGYAEDYVENHPDTNPSDYSSYIQIKLRSDTSNTINNLETYTSKQLTELIKENDVDENGETIYFECTAYYVGTVTKTVNYLEFREM